MITFLWKEVPDDLRFAPSLADMLEGPLTAYYTSQLCDSVLHFFVMYLEVASQAKTVNCLLYYYCRTIVDVLVLFHFS